MANIIANGNFAERKLAPWIPNQPFVPSFEPYGQSFGLVMPVIAITQDAISREENRPFRLRYEFHAYCKYASQGNMVIILVQDKNSDLYEGATFAPLSTTWRPESHEGSVQFPADAELSIQFINSGAIAGDTTLVISNIALTPVYSS